MDDWRIRIHSANHPSDMGGYTTSFPESSWDCDSANDNCYVRRLPNPPKKLRGSDERSANYAFH